MHTFILQDYITIRGSNNTVTQNETGWLDLTPYQDLVFWIDTRELTGTTVTLRLQTSPTKDELLFQNVLGDFTLAIGITTKQALLGGTGVTPAARFVRWQLTCTAAPWDATVRIYVSANSPGM